MTARDVMIAALLASGLQGEYGSLPTNEDADRILSAFRLRGFVVVPVEPTEKMVHDGALQIEMGNILSGSPFPPSKERAQAVYRAMIAAAQEPDNAE